MSTAIQIQPVVSEDMQAIARLMRGLGHKHSVEEVARRWNLVTDRGSNPAFMAKEGSLAVGLLALHIQPLLFYPEPLARITTLVVDPAKRRRGVGRLLMETAVQASKDADCGTLELTTGLQREDAKAFYRALGFECSALRMERSLFNDV